MDTSVKAILAVTSAISLYLLYRLHSRPGHWFQKLALTLLLLVPFLGWIAYLFIVEDVPPQPDDLKNSGMHGHFTDKMITRTRRQSEQAEKSKNKDASDGDDPV